MPNKRKIAIIIDNAFGFGGTERVLSNMISTLSTNMDVDVFSVKGQEDAFYDLSSARTIKHYQGGYISSVWKIARDVKNSKYNSIFVITMGRLSSLFGIFAKMQGLFAKTKIYSCEHVSYMSFPIYIQKIKVIVSKWYAGIIVLTKDNEYWLNERCCAPTYVIPNESPNVNVDKNINIFSYKKAIFVGRLAKQKRLDKLLAYWQQFKLYDSDGWSLDIIGDGEQYDHLISLTRKLEIVDSVNFRGRISNIPGEYQKASLFLMTSEYEGFPMVLLEAQAYGLPCIALDCLTGPKDILSGSNGGFVVTSADEYVSSLRKLCSDEMIFNEMHISAINNSKRFSRDVIKKKWLQVIG